MKVDDNSQLFLLLVWLITLVAFLACMWLLKDVRTLRNEVREEVKSPAPNVVPREYAEKPPANRFVIPPPPF